MYVLARSSDIGWSCQTLMNRFNYLLAMPFTHSMRGPKKLLKHIALRYLASLNTHSTRVPRSPRTALGYLEFVLLWLTQLSGT